MIFAYVFIVLAAILNTAQSGSSATLHKQMNHPILPGIVTYVTGMAALLVVLAVYGLFSKTPLPTWDQWRGLAVSGPWWMWIGGVLGAVYVMAMVNVSQKAGAGVFMGLSVTASILTSLALDNYAWLGFKQHTASVPRLIGAGLMIGGLVLIGKF